LGENSPNLVTLLEGIFPKMSGHTAHYQHPLTRFEVSLKVVQKSRRNQFFEVKKVSEKVFVLRSNVELQVVECLIVEKLLKCQISNVELQDVECQIVEKNENAKFLLLLTAPCSG
jgi:hypothetical protein